ncbi:unnamed protein product [Ectocarpus sp. 6 AP-2014]
MSTTPATDRKPGGGFGKDLANVLFCGLLAQGVAYPLGLDAAAALAMGIQARSSPPCKCRDALILAWVPSALAQNETFYDFTGMLTFMAVTTFSTLGFLPRFFDGEMAAMFGEGSSPAMEHPLSIATAAPRHLVATALVLTWTTRLGTFLLARIRRDGHDSRFNGVRDRPLKFLVFWFGIWVFFTSLPMLVLHKVDPRGGMGSILTQDAFGLAVWATGFALEVVADGQKRAFKADAANAGKFIDVGLWSRCRHPNYLGEMTLWAGFFIFCSRGVVAGSGWLALMGPLFGIAILTFVSTPMLEEGADKKYGGHAAYHEYKRTTPSLFFRLW